MCGGLRRPPAARGTPPGRPRARPRRRRSRRSRRRGRRVRRSVTAHSRLPSAAGARGNERVLRDRDVDSGGDGLVVDLGALFKSELRERPRQLGAGEPSNRSTTTPAMRVVAGGDAGCAVINPPRRGVGARVRGPLAVGLPRVPVCSPRPLIPRHREVGSRRVADFGGRDGRVSPRRQAGVRLSGLPRASAYVATCSRSAPRS